MVVHPVGQAGLAGPTAGKAAGAAKGAGLAAGAMIAGGCTRERHQGARPASLDLALGVRLSPIAAVIRTIHGAIAGEPAAKVEKAERTLRAVFARLDVPASLHRHVVRIARAEAAVSVVSLADHPETYSGRRSPPTTIGRRTLSRRGKSAGSPTSSGPSARWGTTPDG